jgi:hypothetical protein
MLQYDESSLWSFCNLFNPISILKKLNVSSQEIGGKKWLTF